MNIIWGVWKQMAVVSIKTKYKKNQQLLSQIPTCTYNHKYNVKIFWWNFLLCVQKHKETVDMAIIRRFLQLLSLITLLFITAEVNVNQKLRMLLVCLVIMITCFKKESMCLLFQVGRFSWEKKMICRLHSHLPFLKWNFESVYYLTCDILENHVVR